MGENVKFDAISSIELQLSEAMCSALFSKSIDVHDRDVKRFFRLATSAYMSAYMSSDVQRV